MSYIDATKLWQIAESRGIITTFALSRKAGIASGTFRHAMLDNLNITTLIKIADALDVEPRDLLIKPIKEAANDSHI